MALMSVDEALQKVLDAITRLPGETVPLDQAASRVLAEPILAARDQPPFPASAMDGYALAAGDAHEGARLSVVGTSQAGLRFPGTVALGTCVRIFTGAPVPAGADCVIMQEKVDREGDEAILRTAATPGQNIRTQGYDFRAGDTVIEAGTHLSPAHIALAAAANAATCSVTRKPRVALVATGDELVPPGARPGPDQIVASNSIGLAALIGRWGGEPIDLGILPDDPGILSAAFAKAFEDGVDILVTTGGASVGAHDYVKEALAGAGVTLALWQIAMRPGKPMMFGNLGKQLVFGLPGNPVSAMATARTMLIPALLRLLGGGPAQSRTLPLAAPLPPNGARRHFVRARIVARADGTEVVEPSEITDSGHLSSLARCDGFIDHAANAPQLPVGAAVRYLPL